MALSDRDYMREGWEPGAQSPTPAPPHDSTPPSIPSINPAEVGAKVRTTTADYTGRLIGDLVEAAASIPLLLTRPVDGILRIAEGASDGRQVWIALLVNLIGWVVVVFVMVLQLSAGRTFADRAVLLFTTVGGCVLPFISLAVATALARKVAAPPSRYSIGYDALSAASALLPMQVAALAALLANSADWTRWLGFCSYLLCAMILYSAAVRNTAVGANPQESSRLLYLVPVQISAAILIAAQLTSMFAPDLPWIVDWMR
jgi:hypothetical protein